MKGPTGFSPNIFGVVAIAFILCAFIAYPILKSLSRTGWLERWEQRRLTELRKAVQYQPC